MILGEGFHLRNIFTTRLLTVILLIAAVCLGLAAYTGAAGQDSPVSAAVGTVLSPLQKGVSFVTGKVGHLIDHFQNYDEMEAENQELREKVAQLEQQVRDAQVAVDENERLRVLTGLVKNNPTFRYDMAEVIARSPGQWATTVSIDKGSLDGVAENDLVVTAEGMVGYVSLLPRPTARSQPSWTPICRPARWSPARARAASPKETMSSWATACCACPNLSKDSDVVIGDTIQTSGEGGIFPKGIMIGTVERVMIEENGMNNYAVIRPFVDPSRSPMSTSSPM